MATPLVAFVQDGESIDYTPGSNVSAGDVVVQVDLIGVAKLDIAANRKGALAVSGVFDFPKATTSGSAIPAGTILYWDVADEEAKADSESGANKQIGKAVKAATATDTVVRGRLSQ